MADEPETWEEYAALAANDAEAAAGLLERWSTREGARSVRLELGAHLGHEPAARALEGAVPPAPWTVELLLAWAEPLRDWSADVWLRAGMAALTAGLNAAAPEGPDPDATRLLRAVATWLTEPDALDLDDLLRLGRVIKKRHAGEEEPAPGLEEVEHLVAAIKEPERLDDLLEGVVGLFEQARKAAKKKTRQAATPAERTHQAICAGLLPWALGFPEADPALAALGRVAKEARDYKPAEAYERGDVVRHPRYGVGRVLSAARDRIEVEFDDGERRKLVHRRA